MSVATVYRVQDWEGRGPFKPGRSKFWANLDVERPPAWVEEFPDLFRTITASRANLYYGCGCRSLSQLARWFVPAERPKLYSLGYGIVQMDARVLAESDSQLVFARDVRLTTAIRLLNWSVLN